MRRLRDERGLTLVEVMVTMTLAIVVLSAILLAFERFVGSHAQATETVEAQDLARDQARDIVATLRDARIAAGQSSPVPAAFAPSRSDLIVATYVPTASGTAPGWVRYCAATGASGSSLVVGTLASEAYVAPGTCAVGSTAGGWTHAAVVRDRLGDPGRLFDYASSSCAGAACLPAAADITSVGVRVAVLREAGDTAHSSVVRDSASFRNRLIP